MTSLAHISTAINLRHYFSFMLSKVKFAHSCLLLANQKANNSKTRLKLLWINVVQKTKEIDMMLRVEYYLDFETLNKGATQIEWNSLMSLDHIKFIEIAYLDSKHIFK